MVFIKAPDGSHMMELEDEVRALMRARRHVPYQRGRHLRHQRLGFADERLEQPYGHDLRGDHRAGGGVHGGGRIVIMNIMLASVTERTHEIGIRKSVGARRRDILWQFVIESGVMSGIGGVAGVLLAIG